MKLIEDLGNIFPRIDSKRKRHMLIYECACGNQFRTIASNNAKSCGCSSYVHGLTNHRLYKTWTTMIDRCTKPNYNNYENYGGRGIAVCERWKNIENFVHDMYPMFKEGLTLDRIDVYGDYEPNNCRWANKNTQSRNIRIIRKGNTSGYKGVHASSEGKFMSRIAVGKNRIYLGVHKTAKLAAFAYDKYVIDNNLEHTTNGLYIQGQK